MYYILFTALKKIVLYLWESLCIKLMFCILTIRIPPILSSTSAPKKTNLQKPITNRPNHKKKMTKYNQLLCKPFTTIISINTYNTKISTTISQNPTTPWNNKKKNAKWLKVKYRKRFSFFLRFSKALFCFISKNITWKMKR